MTKRVEASPKADTATDYDNLLRANAKRVFSEPDVQQRLTALKELWAEKGVLLENEHVVTGWDAVSSSVGALLKMLRRARRLKPRGRRQVTTGSVGFDGALSIPPESRSKYAEPTLRSSRTDASQSCT